MINTKKKIHIYNRLRTIYSSKYKYYIRYNKKYIDINTIIKKANRRNIQSGGGKKNDKRFLTQELGNIKNGIVIFNLLMDDKQSEAINIYLNLIELINSKRELIINKINTYPQNHFDNELNKAAIITYVKSVLYNNIFNNYLITIIPRIDLNNLVKKCNKGEDVFENIIKLLLHFNTTSDKRILQDIMNKIEKYKDIITESLKSNCENHETLKVMIDEYIKIAIEAVNEAINEPKDEETAEEDTETAATATAAPTTATTPVTSTTAPATATAATAPTKEREEEKEAKSKGKNETNEDEIKKFIYDDIEAIKEGLDNLENKDYVERLLPVLEKESEYYAMFIDINKKFDKESLQKYFKNINEFLEKYKELYDTYIASNTKELAEKKGSLGEKDATLEQEETELKNEERKLKDLKKDIENKQEEVDNIIKKIKELQDKNGDDEEDKESTQDGSGGSDAINPNQQEDDGENVDSYKDSKQQIEEDIKKIKKQYIAIIKVVRKFKIEVSDLKKYVEKTKKKIEAIEKKIKQYKEFLDKIELLKNKITNEILKRFPAQSGSENKIAEYNNITLYKTYIETIIFNIKSKILHYFIMNYIMFCNDLNESKKNNSTENYTELKEVIDKLYENKDSSNTDEVLDTPAAGAGAPVNAAIATPAPTTPVATVTPAPAAPTPTTPVATVTPATTTPAPTTPVATGAGAGASGVSVGGKGSSKRGTDKGAGTNASVCAYITDVEGNLDFFEKYVSISKVIEWVDSRKNRLRFKQKDSIFVFGGDCQDRGIGDIRFVNLLLNFKSEYPDRVEFIIGNRDANKIRIYSELSEKIYGTSGESSIRGASVTDERAVSKYLEKYDNFPYWVNKAERITLRKYLEDNNYKINIVSRLKYILDYTMGSYDSFDKRRKELSIILNKSPDSISDNDIVASFLNSISPNPKNIKNTNDNYLLKYLESGKIAYIFGEHIFVHGAVNKNNIGYIPNNKNIVDDVYKWVSGLNKWFQKDLKEYMANPEYGGISKRRKGYKIIDYAVPSDNKTVVYSDNLKNGNGQYINTKVIKYLNKGGIHSIISGHRPHGDCPLVLRSKKLTAVSADTSYSKKGHRSKWGIDNRGNAVSEVLLYLNGDIQIHGILQDNQKYDYIIKNKETKPANTGKTDKSAPKYDKYIGLQLKNNYWVKNVRYDKSAKSAKSAKYYISYAKGFEYDDKWITEAEMLKLL